MRPPRTAKDDQPGPTGRRQSIAGGKDFQSVLIRTPGTISSRCGPRKPGQMAAVSGSAGAAFFPGLTTAGSGAAFADGGTTIARSPPDWTAGCFSGLLI